VVPSDRTSGHEHNLKHSRLPLKSRKHFFTVRTTKHWHKVSKEVLESPFFEILKIHQDVVLGKRL